MSLWPMLLDLSKDECKRVLRRFELEAYSSIVTAFRAQGDLTKEKKKVLQDLCNVLGISTERHRAEVRRAVNDEKLATVAEQITGNSGSAGWAIEGRRLVPLMPRLVPQTALTAIANNMANVVAAQNASLPLPAATANKQENLIMQSEFLDSAIFKTPMSKATQDAHFMKLSPGSTLTPDMRPQLPADQSTMIEESSTCNSAVQTVENISIPDPGDVIVIPGNVSVSTKSNTDEVNREKLPRRRKRTTSAEVLKVPVSSAAAKTSSISLSTSSTRTVSIPIGGTPVQFTLSDATQKGTSTGTSTTSTQKVYLLSASSSSLPSSLLHRSINIPIVRPMTTSNTATPSQPPSETVPSDRACSPPNTTAGGAQVSLSSESMSDSNMPTPSFAGTASTSTATSASTSPLMTVRPKVKLVPVSSQTTATQTIQLKPGSTLSKPTFHLKDGSGLKIIAQAMSASGAKLVSQQSGGAGGPPIVVVTKSGAHSGTRLVNALSAPGTAAKMFSTGTLSVAKSGFGGTPALVTVGPKGKQTAVFKMPPGVSLGGVGKPNVIVVQKAQLVPNAQGGSSIAVPTSSLTSVAQTVLKSVAGATASKGEKQKAQHQIIVRPKISGAPSVTVTSSVAESDESLSASHSQDPRNSSSREVLEALRHLDETSATLPGEKKSTMLADLLQATGILPEGSGPVEISGVDKEVTSISSGYPEGCKEVVEWVTVGGSSKDVEEIPKEGPAELSSLPNATTNPPAGARNEPQPVSIQQISLPFELQEGQILEIQDASGLVTHQNRLSAETLAILRQAGLDISIPEVPVPANMPGQDSDSPTKHVDETGIMEVTEVVTTTGESEPAVPELPGHPDVTVEAQQLPEPIPAVTVGTLDSDGTLDPTTGIFYPHLKAAILGVEDQHSIFHTAAQTDASLMVSTSKPSGVASTAVCSTTESSLGPHCDDGHGCTATNVAPQKLYLGKATYSKIDASKSRLGQLPAEARVPPVAVKSVVCQEVVDEGLHYLDDTLMHAAEETVVSTAVVESRDVPTLPVPQVSIKDVMSSSESQSSGSSIFMVTDSVVGPEPSVSIVVPSSEEESEPLESSGEGEKIPIAEVTVHEDGTTSYIVTAHEEVETSFDDSVSGTSLAGDASDASSDSKAVEKRKRKTGHSEENANVPHIPGWSRSAVGLLHRVMKFRGSQRMKGELGASHWFLQPVSEDEAPGYLDIVKNPMDFLTIKKKLETSCYQNIAEFHQDMILVKSNCELYNPVEHEARRDCTEVFSFYQQEYDRLIEKWQKAHLLSSPQSKKLKVG